MKKYNISWLKFSKWGAIESIVEVKFSRYSRKFYVDQDSQIIPLDNQPMSNGLLKAICDFLANAHCENGWGWWYVNVQRQYSQQDYENAVKIANDESLWEMA